MKILLAGSTGFVGNIIRTHLHKMHDVTGVSSSCLSDANNIQCDLREKESVLQLADAVCPDVVIHAAGNKNIDFCEKNPEEAFRVNCDSVRNLAQVFSDRCRLIYISTDYVFDGYRGGYAEHDSPEPTTEYGKSKLCGELEGKRLAGDNFVIIRLSALYSINATFVKYLINKLNNNEPVECFSDIVYSPTYYKDFMNILDSIILNPSHNGKVFHASGEATTRYDFALSFAKAFEFNTFLLKKASGLNKGMFLFPNLSMLNAETNRILQIKGFTIAQALQDMKKEQNENY